MNRIFRSKLLWLLVVVVVALLVVRAMLPIWVRDYVNRKLSELEGYSGHVADVDMHLWRGAYSIHAVEIKKTTGNVPVPFFSAPVVDLSVEWKALFHGAFVGEINFVVTAVKGTIHRDVTLRTEREATTVDMVGCTTKDQARPR